MLNNIAMMSLLVFFDQVFVNNQGPMLMVRSISPNGIRLYG